MFEHVIIRNHILGMVAVLCLAVAGISFSAIAQDQGNAEIPVPSTADMNNGSGNMGTGFVLKEPDISPSEIPSLFFTPEALALLNDAIKGLNVSPTVAARDGPPQDPGVRELALGGIVHRSGNDWTIWLNGKRITPEAIPEQVFDLTVYKEYIDIKWFDEYTNRIFPIRLRPNERFNLDGRIFLTGSHPSDQQL